MESFVRRVRGGRRGGDGPADLEVALVEEPEPVLEPDPPGTGRSGRGPILRLVALVLVIVVAGVVGLSVLQRAGAPTIDQLRRQAGWSELQTLEVGVYGDVPGLSDCESGPECTGFDVEIAKLVADWLGVARSRVAFAEVLPENRERMTGRDVRTDRLVNLDLVVAAFSITDQRTGKGDLFAGPYLNTETTVLTRKDHPAVEALSALDDPITVDGKPVPRQRVCTPGTSTSAQYLQQDVKVAEIVALQRNSECVKRLLTKQVDAVVTDAAILAGFQREHSSELKLNNIASDNDEHWGIGIGVDATHDDTRLQARRQLVSLALQDLLDTPGQERWQRAFALLPATIDTGTDPQIVADDRQPTPRDVPKVRRWPWERSGTGSGR